jgi:hypothetical protein
MFFGNKKFKVVVIDYPIYALGESSCAALLGKALKMKFDGYSHTYGDNILPMDKSDFFGTHIMLCEENEKDLMPIFAYKSVALDRCLKHGVEFPILTTIRSDGDSTCFEEINNIIKQANDPSAVSYDSAWAQNLNYRFSNNPELKNVLREITMMMAVKHHEEFKIPHMITCGAVKVKTDQFFLSIGLNKVSKNSHFYQKNLNNEESVVFYNNIFSLDAYRMAKKYKDLWDSKLLIDGREIKRVILNKAA